MGQRLSKSGLGGRWAERYRSDRHGAGLGYSKGPFKGGLVGRAQTAESLIGVDRARQRIDFGSDRYPLETDDDGLGSGAG